MATAIEPLQATVLCADLVGSTALGQNLHPEHIHAIMHGALEHLTRVVEAHHGIVLQYAGDQLLPRLALTRCGRTIRITQELGDKASEMLALNIIGENAMRLGDYPAAMRRFIVAFCNFEAEG